MTLDQRIERLERVVLGLAALMTGEAARVGTNEENAALIHQVGSDLENIAAELTAN